MVDQDFESGICTHLKSNRDCDRAYKIFVSLFLIAFYSLLTTDVFAQKIDLENFDVDLLKQKLTDSINQLRSEQDLPAFTENKSLEKAAKDQSIYNRKFGKIERTQPSRKKANPEDRVASYGGLFYLVDEYDLGMNIQTKSTLKQSSKHKTPSNYNEAADYFISEWMADKKQSELLYSNAFFHIGFGISPNKIDNLLFVTAVVGSEPYQKNGGFNYNKKSYKIRPYDKIECKAFERNFHFLSELFADNIRIENNRIQFYYHDLSLIESFLQFSKDGLTVDVIEKNQFDCSHGNEIYPSKVNSGMLLKPSWKSKLLKRNTLKDKKQFLADLGPIPAGFDTNDLTYNLLIIQNKCMCKKIPYNDLNGENIRLLKMDLVVDTISISQSIDSNSKYLQFTIPFEKSKYEYELEDIKPFLDSIELNRYNIKEVDIVAYASIEGNAMINKELQEKRAQSILKAISEYQLQSVKTSIQSHENWEGFMKSIQGSPYEQKFKGLEREEIRTLVNSDTLGFNIEPYLADQRKADLKIFVESIFVDSLTSEHLLKKFIKAIEENDHIRATALQSLMYRAVLNGQLDHQVLFEHEIPQFKEFTALANNRLAFSLEFNQTNNIDSLINTLRMEVEALLGVSGGNGHLKYNKQAIKLYYWAKDLTFLVVDEENKLNQVKDFEKDIKRLYNTKIDNYKVNRLLMNFNIIAADYYYEKQDFKNRVRALKQVKRFVQSAKLDREQTFVMARYFIFQMQIEWALNIMLPFIRSGDYDQEFLLTFLSIAVYDQKQVSDQMLYEYMETAASKYKNGYCKLFVKPGMSVDYLSDLRLKAIYCENCK